MESAANRSFRPRLSEACRLLPLIRGHLIAAAPEALAAALEFVPIVEEGLFGYELVPDRESNIYPIVGCNARGDVVLRRNSYGVVAPDALRLVAVNGRLLSRNGWAPRDRVRRRDALFPNWHAAAQAAWAQLLPLFPDLPRQPPVLGENTHRGFDKALLVAQSHLVRWDPFIEFFGLPNEAQLGFALMGIDGERGELVFQQPDTWVLRWNAPPDAVCETWSLRVEEMEAPNGRAGSVAQPTDRRARLRRATDRGRAPDPWTGIERRRGRERRAGDQHAQ